MRLDRIKVCRNIQPTLYLNNVPHNDAVRAMHITRLVQRGRDTASVSVKRRTTHSL